MKRILLIASCLIISSCSQASNISEVSAGVYSVATKTPSTAGGTLGAKRKAYSLAQKYCHAKFKKNATLLQVTHEDARLWPAQSSVSITFGCVDDGDPLLGNNAKILMSDEEKKNAADDTDPFAELESGTPAKPFE